MRDPNELVVKKRELEKLAEEYAAAVANVQEIFGKLTRGIKSLPDYGEPGLRLGPEIMALINRVNNDAVEASRVSESEAAVN